MGDVPLHQEDDRLLYQGGKSLCSVAVAVERFPLWVNFRGCWSAYIKSYLRVRKRSRGKKKKKCGLRKGKPGLSHVCDVRRDKMMILYYMLFLILERHPQSKWPFHLHTKFVSIKFRNFTPSKISLPPLLFPLCVKQERELSLFPLLFFDVLVLRPLSSSLPLLLRL